MRFFCSSLISLYVAQLSIANAMIISVPPEIAAADNGFPVMSQSVIATRKMVSNAATEERTGEVSDMSTRKEPEKMALDKVEMARR